MPNLSVAYSGAVDEDMSCSQRKSPYFVSPTPAPGIPSSHRDDVLEYHDRKHERRDLLAVALEDECLRRRPADGYSDIGQ